MLTEKMPINPPTSYKPNPNLKRVKKGLVVINTGNGKGKTTAGFGMMLRAWGRGMDTMAVQFIKNEKSKYGEQMAAEKLGIEVIPSGRGFSWTSKDLSEDEAMAQHGWEVAKEKIESDEYDVIMLDEITYPIMWGWINVDDVLKTIANKPEMLNLIITGRDADPKLVETADLVTEMKEIKHPYTDQGIPAQKGVEF
ncbi:MAG: cob(I)yrinic acid a,c-diamide adenosyltransferase [Dehalococcoidia bacterium]|jgi:cob(I)alamin adenosyltransferase|nr:cob(I)yrinic acid a,c-diamide adenosyltransferase [Dehalococcoidia bacterium]MDP7261780.1 cob(I)yrinic acid a,c-diamide adenosyltransferase [Dehalococcoidia bacterium]MDP7486267.1 cob(I)yrinic acid a,c-diamide adenosyltransferase [Dehalococcoidia bacterium]|tara:strand:- start:1010 stop:1597 length:588 start_codon:yes stop_codon:yes gene_type:complete